MNRNPAVLVGALLVALAACSDTEQHPGSATDLVGVSFSQAAVFPDVIPLPVNPEGIAVGTGSTFYVGSVAGGAIWRGDLRTGDVALLHANDGRPTLGLKFDDRSGFLFAARGPGGGKVYDGNSGAIVASFPFASAPTLANDVIITRAAAYFTDSFRPQLYRVPLGPAGELLGGFAVVPLSGDWVQTGSSCGPTPPGALNANGIEATPDGQHLIVNNLATGRLYRVDPATGAATSIDLGGGNVCLADGNLLIGHTLYVMQNLLGRMAVVELSTDYLSGTITRYITGANPMTTMARFGNSIYAVTAGFPFLPSSQPHQVVRFGM